MSSQSIDWVKKKQRNRKILSLFVLFAMLLALIIKVTTFRRIFIILILIFLNYIFAFVKRYIPFLFIRKYFFGLEIILICTVAISMVMGPLLGALTGPILMIVNYLAERRLSDYFLITLSLYTLIGYSAYFFSGFGIIRLGIIMAICYNTLSFVLSKLLGANTLTLIVFFLVNIISNIFLFIGFGELVLSLLL